MQVLISRPTMLDSRMLPAGLVLELVEVEARRLIALGHAVAVDSAPQAEGGADREQATKGRRKA